MRQLGKSIEEYLAAGGWSSHNFLEHAKAVFEDREVKRTCTFEVGRSVIYIRSRGTMLKAYVHHAGRSREFMTLKDEKGDEVKTFHMTAKPAEVVQFILGYFRRCHDPEST